MRESMGIPHEIPDSWSGIMSPRLSRLTVIVRVKKMKKLGFGLILFSLVVAACVTINVYFPAAAAEKAAEEFVGDVLGEARTVAFFFPPTWKASRC
jgi:predicted aminopeptidase